MGAGGQDASVAFVTQTYTNYVNELQGVAQGLRQRALALQQDAPAQLQQLQSQIQPQTQELVQTLQETQTPISIPTSHVIDIFGWSSILLLSSTISGIAGGYLLTPLLGVFLGRFGSAILASVGLPIGAYLMLKEKDGSTAESRFQLLALSAGQGLLMGHAVAHTYVASQPIAFLTPLIIAFAYPLIAGQVGTAHTPLLGGAVGASLAINLALGLVLGYLSFSYLMLSLLYSVSAAGTLQIAFKNLKAPSQIHLYQIGLVASMLFSKALVFGVFGGSEPVKQHN